MKLPKILMLSGVMAMLTACSEESMKTPYTHNDNIQSYIKLSISLPTEPTTRTSDFSNDQFYDGTPEEYAVNYANIVIFEADEDKRDATVVGVYDLTDDLSAALKDNRTEVTGYFNIVKGIQQRPADNLYALVILNLPYTKVEQMCVTEETKMSSLISDASTDPMLLSTDNGFVMMNAPVYDSNNDKKTYTFKKLNPTQMYKSATLAQTSPNAAFEIYVERVLAKATLKISATDENKVISVGTSQLKAGEVRWNLDLTNKSTYPVRNVTDFMDWPTNNNRFYSTASNRIYWAKDPNYTTTEHTATPLNLFNQIRNSDVTNGLTDAAYCFENTFNVHNQRQNRTTRMIIKVQLKNMDGSNTKDFFTLGSVAGIYDLEQIKSKINEIIVDNNFSWKEGETTIIMNNADNISYATNRISTNAGSHKFQPNDIMYEDNGNSYTVPTAILNQINGKIIAINTYKNGECYYVVRLQHFGDTYCPWEAENDPTYGDDPEATIKFLGRYGMVRNNWYEVNVTKFSYLGLPSIPAPNDKPDDENVYYLNFHLKIHAWAKRIQEAIL